MFREKLYQNRHVAVGQPPGFANKEHFLEIACKIFTLVCEIYVKLRSGGDMNVNDYRPLPAISLTYY